MTCRLTVAGRSLEVASGTRLSVALNQGEVHVETPCGARGYCRKCLVKILGEAPAPTPADREQLSEQELALGFRLSCQLIVDRDLAVAVMPAALADGRKAGLGRLAAPVEIDPWASLNPAGRSLGLALDVGTTGMAGALLDLTTGEELAAAALPNPQAIHGADVMSRLSHALQGEAQREELGALVRSAAAQMLERLLRRAGAARSDVVAATLVGNTAMHHLFLGLPVDDLALAPYRPARQGGGLMNLPDFPPLYALPIIAGFVGADAVAAALAVGLDGGEGTRLLIDIGTNGEVLLRHRGRLYACSAPAGPAFEGGEISQGMRAAPGAIEAVEFRDGDLAVRVIQGAEARGICGSGLLDAAAALLEAGLLDPMGRLRAEGPAAHRVADGGRAAELAPGIRLTQKDLRALQLAKGAVRAGVDLLLREAGIGPGDLDEVLLAGAFGNYLRRESAVATGLLPPVDPERIRPVGNAAAAGAKMALLSRGALERAETLARSATFVELATHPEFEEVFMEALNFPRQ